MVNGDGRFVGPATSLGFIRETIMAYRSSMAWLHWNYADYPTGFSVAPRSLLGFIEPRLRNRQGYAVGHQLQQTHVIFREVAQLSRVGRR